MNNGTYQKRWSIRIHLTSIDKALKLINKVMNLNFSHNKKNSNKLVKKCVRIDETLFQALNGYVSSNESYISKTVSNAVLDKIKSRVIDIIETENFNHRITVRFTPDQYELVKQTIDELKKHGFRYITFSRLVRSILYIKFKLVAFIDNEVTSNVA